ncbi:hypothetical protein BH09ACT6_BH09ACT6_03600 [soil metagenome]
MPHDPRDVAAEIRPLYEGWMSAIGARDRAWFERTFADDLRVRNVPRSQERGKAAMIEFELTVDPLHAQTLSVSAFAYGDVALSQWSVLLWAAGEDRRSTPPQHALFNSAWRRSGDSWQVFDHIRAAQLPPAWAR